MQAVLKKHLIPLFGESDLERIENFLDRSGGFSFAGEMAIVQAIQDLQEYLSLDEILAGCEIEWKINWAEQDSRIRGSPAADGETGIQNAISIENFYQVVQIPSPLAVTPLDIPGGFFAVKTRHSTYHFGAAGVAGDRIVTRSPGGLEFSSGRVQYLAIGKPVVIERLDNSGLRWRSTPVVSTRLE